MTSVSSHDPSMLSEAGATPSKRQRTSEDSDVKVVASTSISRSAFETNSELFRLLLSTKAEHFVNKDHVVFVCQRDDKVVDVWKGLVRHNFLSVPVLQKTEQRYYGFMDLADIVRHLVRVYNQEAMRSEESFWAKVEEEKLFRELKVDDIMQYPFNSRNPFHPVPSGYSLLHVMEILAREPTCHRIPVVSATDRKLVNMITQSQVIKFLHQNVGLIGTKVNKPLSECPHFFHNVLCVKESAIGIDAFELMVDNSVSGVAVVNDNDGHLVGNLSLRDLKAVGYDVRLFWRFYQTVHNFLAKVRKEYQEQDGRPHHVVFATRESTLGYVLELLAANNIHRVYIVEDKHTKKPIGVISLKDLLLELISA